MSKQTSKPIQPGFLGILSFLLMATPLLLVPAAFLAFDDAAYRAQTIVTGLEWTVVAAGIALALRALARSGSQPGARSPAEQAI